MDKPTKKSKKKNTIPVELKIAGTDKKFDVPVEGCLGLLALGDIGLMLWRKKRRETYKETLKLNKK